jgi:hypothetical protein
LRGTVTGKADPTQLDAAGQKIRQGISICEEKGYRPMLTQGHSMLGELSADAGRREEAPENLKKAEAMGQEMGMGNWLTRTQEALARLGS